MHTIYVRLKTIFFVKYIFLHRYESNIFIDNKSFQQLIIMECVVFLKVIDLTIESLQIYTR